MSPSFLLVLSVAVAAPAPKEPPKKEAPSIVGEWAAVKGVQAGKEQPIPEGGVGFTFTADGKFIVRDVGKSETGRYQTNPKMDPGEIDVIPPEGNKGPIAKGIYKLDGDMLVICIGKRVDRPTKFESPVGAPLLMMTFKRVKKKD